MSDRQPLATSPATDADREPAGSSARVKELEEALAARDRFIAIVGHELRNPMQPIALQTDLLRSAAARGDLARLHSGLDRLHRAIEQYIQRATVLLDVSRALSGQLALKPTEVDLAAIVRGVVEFYQPLAERVGSPLSLDAPAALEARCDGLAFQQISENLVSNAVKYGAGKPIAVSLGNRDGAAHLRVRDQGVGIAVDDQVRIFERFERVVGTGRQGGFGVGLWIVSQLTAAMGGQISLASVPDAGSTFEVIIPIRPGQEPT